MKPGHVTSQSRACNCAATLAVLLLTLTAIGMRAASVSASDALPVAPTFLQAGTAFGGLKVKPATITYTGDGTGILGGASVRDRSSGIKWTRWTPVDALGTGFNQLNDCRPNCAEGKYRGYPVKIELWRPRMLEGTLVFTRMTIYYRRARPHGEPAHYTFTDSHSHGGFSWGPPTATGYCTHTHGLTPAAGCTNIHSLP